MFDLLAMWTPGAMEMIVILVVAVLLFGKRLPEIARGMGKSVTEFKKGLKETTKDIDKDDLDISSDISADVEEDIEKQSKDTDKKA
jgi:sec-independent protein translocase protein TatA